MCIWGASTREKQTHIISLLANTLVDDVDRGSYRRVAASDENSVDDALTTWQTFNMSIQAVVDKVNTHGYSGLQLWFVPREQPQAAPRRGGG